MGDLWIEKGSGAKPRVTFYVDGTATDLDGPAGGTCAVNLLKPDGTAGPASGTVSHVSPTGSGTYEFTLGQQTELIYYDVTWAGTIGGVATSVQTRVEVVGGFLYTLAAMRAVKVASDTPFSNATTYPNQTLIDRRSQVTDDFERRTGWSFIPRFARETRDGDGTSTLLVDKMKVQRVLSLTVDGAAKSVAAADLAVDGTKLVLTSGVFTAGIANVVVEYVHGWGRVPAEISDKGLGRTAMLLLPSQAASTVSTWTTPDGITYSYDQAGQRFGGGGRRHYGIPAIDSTLNDPAYNARGGVFA